MRKGELIKTLKKKFKPGDICFDPAEKILFTISLVDGGIIEGQALPFHQLIRAHAGTLLEPLEIRDVVTGEEFPLSFKQHGYIYKSGYGDNLKFFTRKDATTEKKEAVVCAKNIDMQAQVDGLSELADAFGKYVASQKSMNEPAKKFKDWFFDVSI